MVNNYNCKQALGEKLRENNPLHIFNESMGKKSLELDAIESLKYLLI